MVTVLSIALRSWRAASLRPSQTYPRLLSTTIPRFSAALASQRQTGVHTDAQTGTSEVLQENVQKVPFSILAGKVDESTLHSLTRCPFRHTHMTDVQNAVFSRLPQLAEPYEEGKEGQDPNFARDLMVRAKTGTGKTIAFLVPAIESRLRMDSKIREEAAANAGAAGNSRTIDRASTEYRRKYVGTLILSPTRELATQIAVEASKLLSNHKGYSVQGLIGGLSKGEQMRQWRRGPKDVVVATAGRLRDFLENEPEFAEAFSKTQMLILDEADTMLDMGFREDIEAIVDILPPAPERQTFVFSATMSKAMQQVARKTLSKNHDFINTVPEDDSPVHEHIPQYHTVLPTASEQIPHILRLLAHDQLTNPGKSKAIIFLPTTKMTELFAKIIRELGSVVLPSGRGTKIYELHSGKTNNYRVSNSDRFRYDKSGAAILITSDVSARGVDYPGITRVIQISIPSSSEQYIHRVGRTGRAGGTNGRGDIVLLPWEHNFIRMDLADVPLKPVTVDDLKNQVSELAEENDSNPQRSQFKKAAVRINSVDEEFKEIQGVISQEVEDAFSSMLGYYSSKPSESGMTRDSILNGLRTWSIEAGGLEEAPSISEAFLKRIGFGSKEPRQNFNRKRGQSGGGFRDRGRGSSLPWTSDQSERSSNGEWDNGRRGRWNNDRNDRDRRTYDRNDKSRGGGFNKRW